VTIDNSLLGLLPHFNKGLAYGLQIHSTRFETANHVGRVLPVRAAPATPAAARPMMRALQGLLHKAAAPSTACTP
jgi:hypothetical protein